MKERLGCLAEIFSLLVIGTIIIGLLKSFLTTPEFNPMEIVSRNAFFEISSFSFAAAVTGVIIVICLAYLVSFSVMYLRPKLLGVIASVIFFVFALPYYIVLQSLLAWFGSNGIIASLMSQGAQGSTWLGNVSSYDVVFATAIGYLWRYFPIALVFFYFALLAIPRRVVAAARNMNISWLRIHYAILLPGIKNTLFLLTIFLFLTFLFDGVSVAVLGYGQSQTFGSLLLETASTMSLVGAASAGGIVYLVIASVILFQFLSCMSEEIETSARVDDCEDFGGFKGWKSDITALVNVLWIAIYGITITCGILLLSVGYDRDSRGFFSRGLPTFEGYTTMFLRGGGLEGLKTSLLLASLVASLVVGIGLLSAWTKFKLGSKLGDTRRWTDVSLLLPLLLPSVVISRGISEVRGWLPGGTELDWLLTVILQTGLFVGISTLLLLGSFRNVGLRPYQAAVNHGVRGFQLIWLYIVASRRAIIAAWIAVFTFSINEVPLTMSIFGVGVSPPLAVLLEQHRATGLGAAEYSASSILSFVTLMGICLAGAVLRVGAQSRAPRHLVSTKLNKN